MKKKSSEIVFILDRSGSMSGLEEDTVGGFNSFLDCHRKEEGSCLVSLVLFDHESLVFYDREKIDSVRSLTKKDYQVRGSTALVDAIGGSVHHISDVHKYIRKEDVPDKTVFIIITDGMENSSHIYTVDKVKKMIKEKEEKGWEFIFLGANIESAETAESFGIDRENAADFHADSEGTAAVFSSVASASVQLRRQGKKDKSWREKLDRDYISRK